MRPASWPRLNRIIVLKDLGFTLDQVCVMDLVSQMGLVETPARSRLNDLDPQVLTMVLRLSARPQAWEWPSPRWRG
jgi:hypothetical protein